MVDDRSRRRFIETALATGLLVPGGVGGLVSVALAQGNAAQGIRRMRGEVLVNGQPAKQGATIRPSDAVITTGPKSFATFVIGQDAFLLRGNSRLELSGSATVSNVFRLLTGKLLSVYAKGKGARQITGTTATIGIRGTGAYIEAEPDKTYFCLCYGEAEIVPDGKPEARETVRTTHHESPRYIYAPGAETIIDKAPVINHTDDELILLESLVRRTPPFIELDEYKSGVRY